MNPLADLLKLKGDLLAYHTIMKGEFDTEIARLEALNEELKGKMGVVTTLEEARHEAASMTAVVREEVEKRLSVAKQAEADALVRLEDVKVREAQADQKSNLARELELQTRQEWDALVAARNTHELRAVEINKTIALKQADLDKSAAAVQQQKAEVDAKVARFAEAVKGL